MMFIGFGFLMTFLKKYGYGSVGFNMLITVYVIEWAILIAGWLESLGHNGMFQINLTRHVHLFALIKRKLLLIYRYFLVYWLQIFRQLPF